MARPEHFDAVVIGSGFGGSVSAYRLAQAGLRVRVLERGKRYPPHSFARTPREMHENFWDPSGGTYGLFQLWNFTGIEALVSSGLGGGSLIYANVLLRKDEEWFVNNRPGGSYEPWPVTRDDLDPHYGQVEHELTPTPYPLGVQPYSKTKKTLAYKAAAENAGFDWFLPPIAITFGNDPAHPVPGEPIVDSSGGTTHNVHGRTRLSCVLCGECDVGCNYGAKNTLDYTYLTMAEDHGAELCDLCEVRSFAPHPGGGFSVEYVHHDLAREGVRTDTSTLSHVTVTTDRLVLAAGTFGSTFLLLKNADKFPGLSKQLGHNFSGNGDLLGFVHPGARWLRRVRTWQDFAPTRGPVITSTIRVPDARDGGDGPGYYVQEGGFPEIFAWLTEAADAPGEARRATRFALRRLWARLRRDPQTDLDAELAKLIGDGRWSSDILPLLGMGRDTPDGVMCLSKKDDSLELAWDTKTSEEYFARVRGAMGRIAGAMGEKLRINPLWYLRQKVITVHALGGCPMGGDIVTGVVDSYGRVFGYAGFYVADGSVMPGPVGPNPSLTIAALADRFADRMIEPVQVAAGS